jgi:molybdate transport system substrate-binding protein
MRFFIRRLLPMTVALLFAADSWADQAQIAVAANFAEPIRAIAAVLEKTTGHTLSVTVGATGKLYAQIKNGAPFDLLLAANTEAPAALENDGLAKVGSSFTYAIGKLVVWSADPTKVDARGNVLKGAGFRRLAYANPKTAPYGEAALQTMDKLGLTTTLTPKLVQGESIGQAFSFVQTGNAEIGFLAMSQVLQEGKLKNGSMWVVPQTLYSPIRQNAVLLDRGTNNAAAVALVKLLHSANIKNLIRSYGYDI